MRDQFVDVWEALSSTLQQQGRVYRRLHPESDLDLRAVLNLDNGELSLSLLLSVDELAERVATLPSTRMIDVVQSATADALRVEVDVVLKDKAFQDVFKVMVDDLADACVSASSEIGAYRVLVSRLGSWRDMMERVQRGGLNRQYRRGLFGELYFILRLAASGAGADHAVMGWIGPSRAPQDFQFNDFAVEVKVSSGLQPQHFVVANEREFDRLNNADLFCFHISVDERTGGIGMSLNDLVERIRFLLEGDYISLKFFQDGLTKYGYIESQLELYLEPKYTVRDTATFNVKDEFPRIVESDLRTGVGSVKYSVSVDACSEFSVGFHEIVNKLDELGES
ncbi:PD-(D/E)XK motif protein [Rhodococcus fascians]|nr:PD-(D/E)XK motif protein [Rhodococcus fascians]MBY3996314.1 PD-(D/E)XK motif protein [Rhodococcus fascians]MBY4002971.1 PD-(D/E)XK motif protein [Rhodococcus fascians]MBY4007721.1 PD-(D/E)XK motif protein [Rhodococcus fascians]MBY4017526.1 PD-(D/E)XK motif protein [Rhodococcus fascians]